jgi:hypothetical protein
MYGAVANLDTSQKFGDASEVSAAIKRLQRTGHPLDDG